MKMFFKKGVLIAIALIVASVSCSEEDDGEDDTALPAIDRGTTEANRIKIIFSAVSPSIQYADTAELYDPDGIGGADPIILDTLELQERGVSGAGINYKADIQFFLNESNVTPIIESNYRNYIVCYRDFQTKELKLQGRNLDPDNNFLGIESDWLTAVSNTTSGEGNIRISLNYQSTRKRGLCDAGVRIFENNLPYKLVEGPPIDRGHTEANRVKIIFSSVGSIEQYSDTAEIYDIDGIGGNDPFIVDTLKLKWKDSTGAAINYQADIEFYSGTNNVTSAIQTNEEDYIICYRDFESQELILQSRDNDADGKILGLSSDWLTVVNNTTSGKGRIRISLNYQAATKNDLCDEGIRIFENNIPYKLN